MLQGSDGNQSKEVSRLCDWLVTQRPDVIIFSNLLIAGCISEIKRRVGCPVVVMLQGDDIFYEGLIEPYRSQALELLKRLARQVDRFVVHSAFYRNRMQPLLGIDAERIDICSLAIDPSDFVEIHPNRQARESQLNRPLSVGYLARLAPEKGLHNLIDAFIDLRQRMPTVQLQIAGWLGKLNEGYWSEQRKKLSDAGLEYAYTYHGSVDRRGKLDFLRSIDLLCVPTDYQEPKGLFVLESMAAGIPVLQPNHGAFPELIERLGGGGLYRAGDREDLVKQLGLLLSDQPKLIRLGDEGRRAILEKGTIERAAIRLIEILAPLVEKAHAKST
jgi:glycosyltransferase involved in cell wall biosynthesis